MEEDGPHAVRESSSGAPLVPEVRGSVTSSGLIARDVEGSLWVEVCTLVGGPSGVYPPDGREAHV
jgi:hypothetical protein